ncbi:MAG: hypothetical protein FWF57_05930 [Defluviitaleaceae bacterium]|nr:hypothetical protein [Defluviitaleaceae bacterium]
MPFEITEHIKECYIYQDEKTKKFWRYEYIKGRMTTEDEEYLSFHYNNNMVINYGKFSTIGKYEIMNFDTKENLFKYVKKITSSKIKKGYILYDNFDYDNHIYIDDSFSENSTGPHILTSHPNFRKHFKEDFYYNCTEEFSPFGSDEGADVLSYIEDMVRKNKNLDDWDNIPIKIQHNNFGFDYYPPIDFNKDVIKEILEQDEYALEYSDHVNISTAFAQIKIKGRINKILKGNALASLKRFIIILKLQEYDVSENWDNMIEDLENFTEYEVQN